MPSERPPRVPNVIVVSAPSGAGKSTVLGRVLQSLPGLRFSVSHTTRAPRPTETDGVQYHFVSHAGFADLVGANRFLEWAEVHGQRYGTCLDEYERAQRDAVDLLLDLDVQGAAQVRARIPEAVLVFLLPPSYQDLERRLRSRGHDDDASLRLRLKAASAEVQAFARYDYVLVNREVDECAEMLSCVIRAARCRTSRFFDTARDIVGTFRTNEE